MNPEIELIYTSPAAQKPYEGTGGDADLIGPAYATEHSAAFDLRAMLEQTLTLLPGEQHMIPTGIKLNMLQDWKDTKLAALILPRSGRGSKEGLVIANTVGLIDEDFQGEISFCAWARPTSGHVNVGNARLGGTPINIEPGERIGQLIFVPAMRPTIRVVNAFSQASERGAGGYGSTGKS